MKVYVDNCSLTTFADGSFTASASGDFCYKDDGVVVRSNFEITIDDKKSCKLFIQNAKIFPAEVGADIRLRMAQSIKRHVKYDLSHALRENTNRVCRIIEKVKI